MAVPDQETGPHNQGQGVLARIAKYILYTGVGGLGGVCVYRYSCV